MKAKVKVDLYWIQKNTELGIVVYVCTPITRGSKVPGQSGLYSKTVSKYRWAKGMEGWMDGQMDEWTDGWVCNLGFNYSTTKSTLVVFRTFV